MTIERVELKNFGCIKYFNEKFGKGIIVLSGENGNGKSTVFKAILMAVFDTYEGTFKDYVNWEPGCEGFEILVEFTDKGHLYKVFLAYSKVAEESTRLLTRGESSWKGQEALNHLKAILDPELSRASMIIMEQQVDIVNTKPAARRDLLKKIWDLEFGMAQERLSELGASSSEEELKTRLAIVELENKVYPEPELPELPFSSVELNLYREELNILETAKSQAENKLRSYQEALEEIEKTETEYTKLESEHNRRIQARVAAENALAEFPVEKNRKRESLEQELESAKNAFIYFTPKDTSDLEKSLEEIRLVRPDSFDDSKLEEAVTRKSSISTELKNLSSATSTCYACGQNLPSFCQEDHDSKIASLTSELQNVESEVQSLREEKIKASESLNKFNNDKLRQSEIKAAIQKAKSENESSLNKLNERIDRVKSDLKNLEEVFKVKEESLTKELSSAKDFEVSTEDSLRGVKTRLLALKAKTLSDPSPELAQIEMKVSEINAKIRSYEDTELRIKEIAKQIESIKEEKARDSERHGELRVKLQKVNQSLADIEVAKKILKTDFPVYVINKTIKTLENYSNDFLKKTYGGKYNLTFKDKNNSLRIVYGQREQDVMFASGYERQVFNVAFKQALAQTQKRKTLMMDEADSAASTSNSKTLYRVLGNAYEAGIFSQILMVSHRKESRDMLASEYDARVLVFQDGRLIQE